VSGRGAGLLAQSTRRRLFALFAELGGSASTEQLADRLAMHPNGVRTQLARMEAAGLLLRMWRVDRSLSTVGFLIRNLGVATVRGRFSGRIDAGDIGPCHGQPAVYGTNVTRSQPWNMKCMGPNSPRTQALVSLPVSSDSWVRKWSTMSRSPSLVTSSDRSMASSM
jgi:hypothetical protein